MRYRVRIPYVEPTFDVHARRPPDAPPFVAEVVVTAASPDEAIEVALAKFEQSASESGVGWIREALEEQVTVRAA